MFRNALGVIFCEKFKSPGARRFRGFINHNFGASKDQFVKAGAGGLGTVLVNFGV